MWTDLDDRLTRCIDPPGAVKQSELVARLLHSNLSVPEHNHFQRSELQPSGGISNMCGDSSGASLVRTANLTVGEIRKRAEQLAGSARVSEGAVLALAKELRKIRSSEDPDTQVVFVYDDADPAPMGDKAHAVLRVALVDRSEFNNIRDRIVRAFGRTITP